MVKLSLQHGRGTGRETNPWLVTFECDHAGIVRTVEQRRGDAEEMRTWRAAQEITARRAGGPDAAARWNIDIDRGSLTHDAGAK